jgi:ABC-type polysaccharide/polyol phosphate export permease
MVRASLYNPRTVQPITAVVRNIGLVAQKARVCMERDAASDFGSPWSFGLQLGHLALAVVAYYFLATQLDRARLDGYAPFGFLLIGIMVQGYMTTVLVMFTKVIQDNRLAGTLKATLTTRTSPLAFVALSSTYPFCRATIDVGGYLLIGVVLGWPIMSGNLAGASLVFLLSLVTFSSLGLALATLSLVSRGTQAGVTALVSASWLLSGGLYPVAVLPEWLRGFAPWLPATHAISALRATLLDNASIVAIGPQVAALTLFAVLAVPASAVMFAAGLRHARVHGTLGRV